MTLQGVDSLVLYRNSERVATALRGLYTGLDLPAADQVELSLALLQEAAELRRTPYAPAEGVTYPTSNLGGALQDIVRLLKSGVGLRVASVDVGGWDLHSAAGVVDDGDMTDHLRGLDAALSAFAADLGDALDTVSVVTMSEFGRRVAENGSGGTDHGGGNAMFVLGGGVVGGMHGKWPGLADAALVEGDLAGVNDYRDVLAEVVRAQLGVASMADVFPAHRLTSIGILRRRPRGVTPAAYDHVPPAPLPDAPLPDAQGIHCMSDHERNARSDGPDPTGRFFGDDRDYDDGGDYDDDDGGAPPVRRRSRLRRTLLVMGIVVLVLAMVVGGGLWYLTDRYAGNIARIPDVFDKLDPATRPDAPDRAPGEEGVPLTFLLVGSDSRSPEATTGTNATADAGSQRSDVIMLLQLSADRTQAFAVSFPRDSYVPVPGYGTTKINAAYSYGGPTLLIQTMEQLTDVRIDHFLAVDFVGFKAITDSLGGVDVRVAETTRAFGVTFTQGINHLDGDEALAYVRQRYQLPGGDLDRVQRQQSYLRAVMATVTRDNLLTDPGKLDDFLLAVTGSVSVDDELSDLDLVSLAISLRGLNPRNVAFLTIPVAGLGMEGSQSVVYLDEPGSQQLYDYIQQGTLQDHLGEFENLPAVPR